MKKRKKAKKMKFRYSNRPAYYFLTGGGSLLLILCCIPPLRFVFFTPGAGFEEVRPFWLDQGILFAACIVFLGAAAIVLPAMSMFLIARQATDRHGAAHFLEDRVRFVMGLRVKEIPYIQIQRIRYHMIRSNSPALGQALIRLEAGMGPNLYRLILYTPNSRLVIPASFQEAWECRRLRSKSKLYAVAKELSSACGLAVEETA